jgi:DNA-3-methyladenine glycosylase
MNSRNFGKLRPLPRSFYNRDARKVAKELLGKLVVRRYRGAVLAGRIVENEAYLGVNDPAAHAAAGRTARTEVLFGPPGHAYVYFIYGNHYCLNVSCEPVGEAGCVLIRALEPIGAIDRMTRLRALKFVSPPARPAELRLLTSGPGRLCQAMAITRARDNGKDVTLAGDLFIADDGFLPQKIASTPRIGISKAADEKLRYLISGNPYVSGKRA